MTDYSKVCWYCGSGAIVKLGSYYVCEKCGATWNETPEPAPGTMLVVEVKSKTKEHGVLRGYRTRKVKVKKEVKKDAITD